MPSERAIVGPAQYQRTILLPIQLAMTEAVGIVWDLIGEEHAKNFLVVGGSALLFHGSDAGTKDADLAITADSMDKFLQLARNDPRFTEHPLCPWRYHSFYGFDVEIDFLDKLEEYMQGVKDHCLIQGVPVATLAHLTLPKGYSWIEHERMKYLVGLRYVVQKMERTGIDFKGLGKEGRELLNKIIIARTPLSCLESSSSANKKLL